MARTHRVETFFWSASNSGHRLDPLFNPSGPFMDIIFNCPKCEQELAVDKSGAGTEINCPSCAEKIVIPPSASPPSSGTLPVRAAVHTGSAMSSSAAAKVERHPKVPDHNKPA